MIQARNINIKKIILIGIIILVVLALIIWVIYLLSSKKEEPIKILDQDPSISRFGQCNIDEDCEKGSLDTCRFLTYSIENSDGSVQYIKKGDSYCVDWCEANEDCLEGEICGDFDYIDREEVKIWKGCINPDSYMSVLDMVSQDTWIE